MGRRMVRRLERLSGASHSPPPSGGPSQPRTHNAATGPTKPVLFFSVMVVVSLSKALPWACEQVVAATGSRVGAGVLGGDEALGSEFSMLEQLPIWSGAVGMRPTARERFGAEALLVQIEDRVEGICRVGQVQVTGLLRFNATTTDDGWGQHAPWDERGYVGDGGSLWLMSESGSVLELNVVAGE